MLDEALILKIRERAMNPSTRLDVPCSGDLIATAGSEKIRHAEQSLGFSLHPEHRQILMNVGNGGFGVHPTIWGDGLSNADMLVITGVVFSGTTDQ